MTPHEQLIEWVKGNSLHNHERTYNVVDARGKVLATKKMEGGECCPDFSCCQPQLKWRDQERQAFLRATERGDAVTRGAMLGHALAGLLKDSHVHVAGSVPEDNAAVH